MQTKGVFVQFVPIILILFTGSDSSLIPNYLETLTLLMKFSNKISNPECRNQLFSVGTALLTGEEWAFKMVDAMAKPQAGVMAGNVMHMGNYDECLEIDKNFNGKRIQGKYCSASFLPHPIHGQVFNEWIDFFQVNLTNIDDLIVFALKLKLSYGFCVPKACPVKDLQSLAELLEDEVQFPLHFTFAGEFCDAGDRKPFTTAAIVAMVIFSIFAAIVVCSTLYDVFLYQQLSSVAETTKQPNLFVAFSLITNGKILLATQTTKDNLGCLNGLRVISLMWIILHHEFQYLVISPNINTLQMLPKLKDATETPFFYAGPISVDTFLTVSGLLVVYLFMKAQARGIKFSLPMYYVHRILRLSPSLAMVVLFSATLITYMGSGPIWITVGRLFQVPCEKNWWSTLLYLQTYIHPKSQCLGHAWYLAVDTQMYFLSPVLFLPLLRWPKQTIGTILVIIIASCSYVFGITWKEKLAPIFLFNENINLVDAIYVRCATYLMGMICGYFVYKTRTTSPVQLSKIKVLILWLFVLSVMTGIILSHSPLLRATEYNAWHTSFFNSLARIGWSISVSLIILLCVNGYGGSINDFLSSRIFTVLIRVNYSVYLLHPEIMFLTLGQIRTPGYLSNLFVFHHFWGDYIYTVGVAVIWVLVFELPVLTIEKIVFGKKEMDLGHFHNVKTVNELVSEQFDNGNVVASNAPRTE